MLHLYNSVNNYSKCFSHSISYGFIKLSINHVTFSKKDSQLEVPCLQESGSDEQESSSNLASSHDHTISDASELSDEHPPSGHSSIDCIGASGSDNDASGAIPGRQNLSDADAVGSRVRDCHQPGLSDDQKFDIILNFTQYNPAATYHFPSKVEYGKIVHFSTITYKLILGLDILPCKMVAYAFHVVCLVYLDSLVFLKILFRKRIPIGLS